MSLKYSINKPQSLLLDFLRAITAQGVLLGHLIYWKGFISRNDFPSFFGLASYCVLIFFILSGFLISQSMFNKDDYSFKRFFIDRFSRIYTSLFPALIFVFFIDCLGSYIAGEKFYWALNLKNFISNLLMLQEHPVFVWLFEKTNSGIYYLPYLGSNLPLWTLSIEWWLYMVLGWTLLAKVNKGLYYFVLILFLPIPLYQLFVGTHMGAGITMYWFLGVLLSVALNGLKAVKIDSKYLGYILIIGGLFGFLYSYFAGALVFLFGLILSFKLLEDSYQLSGVRLTRTISFFRKLFF